MKIQVIIEWMLIILRVCSKYSKAHDDLNGSIKQQSLAFCNFHLGDYKKALNQYEETFQKDTDDNDTALNIGVCMFYLGMYEDAQKAIENLPETSLKVSI